MYFISKKRFHCKTPKITDLLPRVHSAKLSGKKMSKPQDVYSRTNSKQIQMTDVCKYLISPH